MTDSRRLEHGVRDRMSSDAQPAREDQPPPDQQSPTPQSDEIPPVEDASEPDEPMPEAIPDDESEPLDPAARALEGSVSEADEEGESAARQKAARVTADSDSDTDAVVDAPSDSTSQSSDAKPTREYDLEYEGSAHKVVVELKHVEQEVRQLLEDRDTRRKRKLSGTHRWRELEDDIRAWRSGGRFDETSLDRLCGLVNRRHYLFKRLRFLAATRPTWNS